MDLALELLHDEVTRLTLNISNTGDATGIYAKKLKETWGAIVELQKILNKRYDN